MVDAVQPTESPQAAAQPLLAPSMNDVPSAPTDVPATTYDNSTPQDQVKEDVAAEPAQASSPKQPASYQDQVSKLQKAGFSGDEIQNYSINQAVKLRQAGFSQDEVDAYQGMKPPTPGTPPIYGRVPTDDDFHNAATVILHGNDHPWYQNVFNTLTGLHAATGVTPEEAAKATQTTPQFQDIMDQASGSYLQETSRTILSGLASAEKGIGTLQAFSAADKPLFDVGLGAGKDPEQYYLYQKGVAFQKWIDDNAPEQPKLESEHPYKTGAVNFAAQLPDIIATLGTSMVAGGSEDARASAREQGASIENATDYAGKVGMLWAPLGLTDTGVFFKTIERSAPGALPWIVAKGNQFLRNGAVLTATNELGDKLSSEIAQASDIPIQYKPTLQRIVTSFLGGGAFGMIHPTGVKEKATTQSVEEPSGGTATSPQNDLGYKGDIPHITVRPEGLPVQQPNAPIKGQYTPAYHFDTDSYGIKNDKGEFVHTGFSSEAEATQAASEMAKPIAEERQPIAPEVVDRYKQTISDEAEKKGFALTPEQLDQAAKVIAESHNKEKAPTATETQSKPPEKTVETPTLQEKPQTPIEVATRAIPAEVLPKLPRELAGAKSGYKTATPQFASDVDKALYIVRDKSSGKSASHDKYVDFLKNKVGMSDAEIQKGSEDVLAAVKQSAEGKKGKVEIPHVYAADKDIETTVPIKRTVSPFKNPNVIQLAAELGGIKDEGGELKSMEAHKVFVPGRGRLVRDTGVSLDRLGEVLQDRGYVKERPTKAEVIEMLREGINGNHTHAEEDRAAIEDRDEKQKQSAYHEDLERHAGEMGIDTTGMKPEQIHFELEKQLREAADDHNFLDEIDKEEPESQHDYYPDMEEAHANETVPPSAHEGHESEVATGNERPESEAGNEGSGEGAKPIDAAVSGRGAEGTTTDAGRTGTDGAAAGTETSAGQTFDRVSNVEGSTEQGVLGGMEKSAKQAMASRGEKLSSKAEQKPANDGLFGNKNEDRGEFAFQKGGLNRGILSAKREEFPSFDKLMKLVEQIAPGASLRIQHLIDNGDAHGSYNYAEQLITLARTSPDVWHTLPHEAFHAIEHLLTPEERTVLLKEAADKRISEKYHISENYTPEEHDREALAHLFGDYASDKIRNPTDDAKTIMDKIKDALSTIGAKVRELFGNESAKDILNKVFSGDIGERSGENKSEGVVYQKSDEKPTLDDALKGIRDTFSPTSAGGLAKPTEVVLRESYGQAKREQAIAETALNEFARQSNEMNSSDHEDFYNYVEGRSAGAKLKNPQFQRMADTIRNIYADYKSSLQKMPETRMMNFVQDYFTHQWAKGQDAKIKEFMNSWWQQGSNKNLKERKIPTIADGLAYGLRLEEPNPVRAVSRYVGSMSHYIASVNVLRAINTDLGGAFYTDGKQPDNYAPLVGRNAERIENARVDEESGKVVPAKNLHLYAPREVADLYNAFYSKGFEDTKLGSAYMMVRNAINTNTMLELGLSAYHFSTINVQSFNQDVGRILKNAFSGDWQGVGQAIKGLVTPGLHFLQGSKLMEQYKDLKDHGVDMEKIANLFASANMRLGIDPLSNISNHGGFYKSWQRGELPGLIDRLKSQMTQGYGLGVLKTGAEVVGKVVSDISHPLFNVYVPSIKMSAFHDLMGDWLRQNPNASDGEISVNSLRIANMVEDRFGEMNMENIFWNKKAKELLGLTFRAPGWDIGLVRQVGGAGADIYRMLRDAATRKDFNSNNLDRPLFMVGAVMSYVAMNAAMTYAKTGVPPSDQTMKDWIAYATGGVHKAFGWHPEHGELPGHGRELIQLAPNPGQGPLSGVSQEVSNKVSTLPKKLYEAANNTDWNGKPIYDPKSNSWVKRTPGVAQLAHVASGFEPFSMEQLFEGQQPGSKLSFAERFMGVRAAGAKITAPKELKGYNEKHR